MEISGTSNRILEVNLTQKDVKEIQVHEKDRKMYLGAKGLGLKLLYDRLAPGIEPLGEDNYLAFMMGVFHGDGSIFYNPEELDADDAMMVLIHAWEGTPLNRDLIWEG